MFTRVCYVFMVAFYFLEQKYRKNCGNSVLWIGIVIFSIPEKRCSLVHVDCRSDSSLILHYNVKLKKAEWKAVAISGCHFEPKLFCCIISILLWTKTVVMTFLWVLSIRTIVAFVIEINRIFLYSWVFTELLQDLWRQNFFLRGPREAQTSWHKVTDISNWVYWNYQITSRSMKPQNISWLWHLKSKTWDVDQIWVQRFCVATRVIYGNLALAPGKFSSTHLGTDRSIYVSPFHKKKTQDRASGTGIWSEF